MSDIVRNFPTMHCHPQSLDSASTPEAFADRELELGTGTLTVTDHGSLGACRKIYDLAHSKGLTPLIGHESYLSDPDCSILKAEGFVPKEYAKYFHITTLFLDQEAFETSSKIISNATYERHGSESKPLFTWENYEEIGATNTIISSGCLIGAVQRHLLDHNRPDIAEKYYQRLRSCAKPGNFKVEIFPHVCDTNWVSGLFVEINEGDKVTRIKFHKGKKLRTNVGEIDAETLLREFNHKDRGGHRTLDAVKDYSKWTEREPASILKVEFVEDYFKNPCSPESPDGDVQKWGNRFVLEMAAKYGDMVIVSDDSHFSTPDQKSAQDVRLMASGGSWRFANSYHRLSGEEQWDYFNKRMGVSRKEFDGWIDNAFSLAERFKSFKFNYKPELPSKFYPSNTVEHLKTLIEKHGRMEWDNPVYLARLAQEIKLFHDNGVVDFLPYFFVYEETCSLYEKNNKLTGIGRGSAAGTYLAYLLGITHLDPIACDLSLDRFITLDRIQSGSFPDIDLDLPSRDLLTGGEIEVFDIEGQNGEQVSINKGTLIETANGSMLIEDALDQGVEIYVS